ncbi:MAG: MFS transporter [Clostridia bacterium]|nr:MFS transporter [Clostridia bacterium]
MKNKFATWVNFVILIVIAMNLTIISPLLESIRHSFSLSISQSGLIFTFNFVGFVVFVLIGGMIADRFGKKPVLLSALSAFTLLLFVFPYSPNYPVLCLIMFLIGGFGGIVESMTMAAVSDLNPQNSGFYVNLSQVFFGVGAIVGPILAGLVVSSGLSWRVCYIGLGILSICLTAALVICKIPKAVSDRGFSPADLKYCLKDVRFLLVCVCMLLYTGSEVGGWGWLCTLLKQKYSFGASMSSIAVAVFWGGMTIGRLICGSLTLRFKTRDLIIFLSVGSAVVTALSCFISSNVAIWAIIACMGLTYSSQYPLLVSFGDSHSSVPSGTSFATMMGSGGVGSMIIPYLMGVIGSASTMSAAMLLPAVMLLLIGVIFIAYMKEPKTGKPSEIRKPA